MNPLRGFDPAPLDVEIIDVWPPGTLGEIERAVYDAFARAGRIIPVGVFPDRHTGQIVVRYRAAIPAQWIHDELRAAKYNGIQIEVV